MDARVRPVQAVDYESATPLVRWRPVEPLRKRPQREIERTKVALKLELRENQPHQVRPRPVAIAPVQPDRLAEHMGLRWYVQSGIGVQDAPQKRRPRATGSDDEERPGVLIPVQG